jgi:aspartate racemase
MSQSPTLAFNTTLFNNSEEIMRYLDAYIDRLHQEADQLKKSHQSLADQCFSSGVLTYIPLGGGCHTHILLLGGMGPLAGAHGMKACLEFLKDEYSITLFQACFVPKRDSLNDIAASLFKALDLAVSQCPQHKSIELIVLCNSAHPYMEMALKYFYTHSSHKERKIRFHSLKASVEKTSERFGKLKCIALQTSFAAQMSVYGDSRHIYSLHMIPSLSQYQKQLTLAIEGVKSFDKNSMLLNAIKVFQALRDYGATRLLMGCTEIPIIVDSLKQKAPYDIQEYLGSTTLFDPLILTLETLTDSRK